MSYTIVTDTLCNLPKEWTALYDIRVIPVGLAAGGDKREVSNISMQDAAQIDAFYAGLREEGAAKTVRTAPANKQTSVRILTDIAQAGGDVLYIGFSSGLSDTFATVKAAAAAVAESYPARTITTVDSLSASLGEGLLVYHAARLREAGKSLDYVAMWLMQNRQRVAAWFALKDTQWLAESGRADGRLRYAGKFGREAIVCVNGTGRFSPVRDVRSRKKAVRLLTQRVAKTIDDPDHATVFIAHGDCIEDAQALSRGIRELANPHECLIHTLDPVLAAAAGPDALGVFFLEEAQ